MWTEDDIIRRLRASDDTVHILTADEANEIAATFEELQKERNEWRSLCDGERRRADANLELAQGFDDEASGLRKLLREARGWLDGSGVINELRARIDAALAATAPEKEQTKMLVSQAWLDQKIKSDPDVDSDIANLRKTRGER